MSSDRHDPTDDPAEPGSSPDPFEAQVRAALAAAASGHTADPDLEERAEAMAARRPRRSRLALLAAAAVVVVLVGSLAVRRDADEQGLVTSPGTTASTTTSTTDRATVLPAPTTPTEVPVPTTEVPSSTTTAPPADPRSVLRVEGIGSIDFGGSAADAERLISDLIGPPVGRYTEVGCPVEEIVSWGSFALWNQGGRLTQWWLIGDQSLGLRTDRGIGIGSPATSVQAAYPGTGLSELHLEVPVRRGLVISDAELHTAWTAVVGDDDRVLALHATPGNLYSDSCFGHGVTSVTLVPGLDGLGPLLIGTPAARAQAVLAAIDGPPTQAVDDGSGTCGTATFGYGPGARTQLLVMSGRLVGYLEGPHDGQARGVVEAGGTAVTTGLTLAELRSTSGLDVVVTDEPSVDGSYLVRITGSDPAQPTRLIATSDGTSDDAVLTRVGVIESSIAC